MLHKASWVRSLPQQLRHAGPHLSWHPAALHKRHAAAAIRAWRVSAACANGTEQATLAPDAVRHASQYDSSPDGAWPDWLACDNTHEMVASLASQDRAAATATGGLQLGHGTMAPKVLDTILGSLLGYYEEEPELFQQYIAGTQDWDDAVQLLTAHTTSLFSQAITQAAARNDATKDGATAQQHKEHASTGQVHELERVLVLHSELVKLHRGWDVEAAASQVEPLRIDGKSSSRLQRQLQPLLEAMTAWLSQSNLVVRGQHDSLLGVRLASVLQAYATTLTIFHAKQGTQTAAAISDSTAAAKLVDQLCDKLSDCLADVMTYPPASPQSLANLAQAIARTRLRSAAVARLAEAVAHEIYRQISNRASSNTPLYPPDVINLLQAYAQFQIMDVAVCRMLDALAGYIVKCVKQKRDAAFKEPQHVAQMLHAYADLNHDSVVIPELVATTARSLAADIAELHSHIDQDVYGQRAYAQQTQALNDEDQPQPQPVSDQEQPQSTDSQQHTAGYTEDDIDMALQTRRQTLWHASLPCGTICQLLEGYHRLRLYPGQMLVSTLMVALSAQLPACSPSQATSILQVLSEQGHYPGASLCTGLLTTLHQNWQQGHASAMQLLTGLIAVAVLNHPLPGRYIEDVCCACLYQEGPTNDADSCRQFLRDPLPPELACQLLFALVVNQEVNIRRLGMACMALRQSPGRTRKLPSQQLACVAAAALMLGEEGKEMIDEVLPADIAADSMTALQCLLESWQNLWRASSANDLRALLRQAVGSQHSSEGTWSLLSTNDGESHAVPMAMSSLPMLCYTPPAHRQTPKVIAVEPLLASDIAINAPLHALGIAIFRRTVLQKLWTDSLANRSRSDHSNASPAGIMPSKSAATTVQRLQILHVSWPYIQQLSGLSAQTAYLERVVHVAGLHQP